MIFQIKKERLLILLFFLFLIYVKCKYDQEFLNYLFSFVEFIFWIIYGLFEVIISIVNHTITVKELKHQ